MAKVIIIGAGMAGLAAAQALAGEGVPVTILEARDRIGGRIHTVESKIGGLAIDLGAEFVHGARNATWELIKKAGLRTREVPDRHWACSEGKLVERAELWNQLEEVLSKIDPAEVDRDFESFLDLNPTLSKPAKQLALEYVEGFHAADPARVSVHALAKAESASEDDEGSRQFEIEGGYKPLLKWFWAQLKGMGAEVRLETRVEVINWTAGEVEVQAETPDGPERFKGTQVLVTLPLGVLQKRGAGGVVFDPRIREKERAIESLAMGSVVKIALQFRSRFWPVDNFGFIHAIGKPFGTWWSDSRGPLLTGWSGGPRAERLEKEGPEGIQAEAIRCLADLFKVDIQKIQETLVAAYRHDWNQDPFSCGAYSYTPARMSGRILELAAPVKDTLYFAGEATDSEGEQGTVHAALASGRRAATQILSSSKNLARAA